MSDSLQPHGVYSPPGPWDFPGMYTGVGCRFLLHIGPAIYYNDAKIPFKLPTF